MLALFDNQTGQITEAIDSFRQWIVNAIGNAAADAKRGNEGDDSAEDRQ